MTLNDEWKLHNGESDAPQWLRDFMRQKFEKLIDEIPDEAQYRSTSNSFWSTGQQLKQQLKAKVAKLI